MMEDMDEFDRMMDEILAKIMEHGEACRLFVTTSEGDVTRTYTIGRGNIHAQYGMIREWINKQEQYDREEAKRDVSEEDNT